MNARPLLSIAWVTAREFLYERVFYLLVVFALLAMALSFLLGQLTYAEKSKLTLDFLLAGIQLSMVLFSLFMGIWVVQREILLGSIALVLSKAISRTTYLLGKFLGQVMIQAVVTFAMMGLAVAVCKASNISFNLLAIFQTACLIFVESCILTAVAFFFAVNTGPIVAGAASFTVFLVGHFTQSATAMNVELQNNLVWTVFRSIIPNLEVFNMKNLAAYSLSMDWNPFSVSLLYGTVCTLMFLISASICFSRKDILT